MKVLIVDDHEDIRDFVQRILSLEEIECETAASGSEALSMAEGGDCDLILLDIQLPDIDGYAVCERLKERPGLSDVPILFLTAMEKPEQVVKGLRAGAVDYIKKSQIYGTWPYAVSLLNIKELYLFHINERSILYGLQGASLYCPFYFYIGIDL